MRKKTSSSSPQPSSSFFHAHCHSRYSPLDAMSSVERLVQKAVMHKQPALALTDHGLMSGAVQLYQNCRKYGIKPFVGIETYLIDPERDDWEAPAKGAAKVGRYHVGLLSFTEDGYKALVKFSSKTHTRPRFNRFARCSLTDLAQLGKEAGEDIALTTGCYFGWLQQTLVNEGYDKAKLIDLFTVLVQRALTHTTNVLRWVEHSLHLRHVNSERVQWWDAKIVEVK